MPQVEEAGTLGGWGFQGHRFAARGRQSQVPSQAYQAGEQKQPVDPVNIYQSVFLVFVGTRTWNDRNCSHVGMRMSANCPEMQSFIVYGYNNSDTVNSCLHGTTFTISRPAQRMESS